MIETLNTIRRKKRKKDCTNDQFKSSLPKRKKLFHRRFGPGSPNRIRKITILGRDSRNSQDHTISRGT